MEGVRGASMRYLTIDEERQDSDADIVGVKAAESARYLFAASRLWKLRRHGSHL